MRMSSLPAPAVNGCSVGSMRQAFGRVPKRLDDLPAERDLRLGREGRVEERVVHGAVPLLRRQLDERRPQLVEDPPHLDRLHLRLVVVQQDVVRLVAWLEALDVPAAELEVSLEGGPEQLPVRRRLRLEPDRPGLGSSLRDLRAQLRWDAHGLLVVPPRETDQPRVVRPGIERLCERLQLVEESADLGVDQLLVRMASQEPHVATTDPRPRRGHDRLLVPVQQHGQRHEAVDVLQAVLQPVERVGHRAGRYLSGEPRLGPAGRAGRPRGRRGT